MGGNWDQELTEMFSAGSYWGYRVDRERIWDFVKRTAVKMWLLATYTKMKIKNIKLTG